LQFKLVFRKKEGHYRVREGHPIQQNFANWISECCQIFVNFIDLRLMFALSLQTFHWGFLKFSGNPFHMGIGFSYSNQKTWKQVDRESSFHYHLCRT
jgi:hypothetical protein